MLRIAKSLLYIPGPDPTSCFSDIGVAVRPKWALSVPSPQLTVI